MQDNLDINALLDDLKKNVLGNQHDDFAGYVNIFVKKDNWFAVDKIKRFIKRHGDTFSDYKDGKMLFGVLKFFLDTAVFQNRDIKINGIYKLLNEFQGKLSWEQSCDLLMDFLDKDWDKDPNNKNFENAKKTIENSLAYLSKLKSKKAYTSGFSCTQKYFKKIMDSVPGIKTPKYLSYISKKLFETDFPPQFCFEIVWLFGDKLLETDIKDLGWHAQFARFRLEIAKIIKGNDKNTLVEKVESCFVNDIVGCFEFLRDRHYNIENKFGKQISTKLIEYLNNKDVDWKTKFSIMNYLRFQDYYGYMKSKSLQIKIPYNNLLNLKNMIRKKFNSPKDLLNVFAKIFPLVKDYKVNGYDVVWYCEHWFYILCFVYSKREIYKCIENLRNENDDAWKCIFLWEVTTYYSNDLSESKVNITDVFKTPDEFLDNVLKCHEIINECDAKQIEGVSQYININDFFSYSIDKIKDFIENTNDPNKLVLLFYTIFNKYGDHFKNMSPLDILDIYIKLYPNIKSYLNETDQSVYESLRNGFETNQLAAALKETDDPKKMILLLNTLNSYTVKLENIKEIFSDPKDLFDACVGKYKSKDKNIEINEANCKCPQPLLNILKKYDKQELDRFTQYFKEENDPLTKSWLSDLVDVKQNFFETYGNVLDFLNKNKNCPQLIKDNLDGIIRKKCDAGFHKNDYLWLLGLESSYYYRDIHHNNLIYLPEKLIEKGYRLISNLFSNSNEHCRTVISEYFIKPALEYHENIWKAVLGLIIYGDEQNQDIKNIDIWRNLQLLCEKADEYNSYEQEYNKFSSQIQNLTLQMNQILTLNWEWFTIVGTFVYFLQLYSLNKRRSHLTAEKNQLQPFVDRLKSSEGNRKSFGLQTSNRNQNKPTPFQYYEKYQTRVEKLLDNMQEIMAHPEKEKILNENKGNEEINNNPNIISTISNNQENKIGGIGD